MANDFSGDSNCKALWRFESGALGADSKSTNTLVDAEGTPTAESSGGGNFKEGACAAGFSGVANALYIANGDLAAGFPLKSSETGKIFSMCCWFKPGTISGSNLEIFAIKGSTAFKLRYGYNSTTLHTNVFEVVLGYGGGSAVDTIEVTASLTAARWYHMGLTVNGITGAVFCRLWDDTAGSYVDKSATMSGELRLSTTELYFGYMDSMVLDEFVVFNDILTSDEIDLIRGGIYPTAPATHDGAGTFIGFTGQGYGAGFGAGTFSQFTGSSQEEGWTFPLDGDGTFTGFTGDGDAERTGVGATAAGTFEQFFFRGEGKTNLVGRGAGNFHPPYREFVEGAGYAGATVGNQEFDAFTGSATALQSQVATGGVDFRRFTGSASANQDQIGIGAGGITFASGSAAGFINHILTGAATLTPFTATSDGTGEGASPPLPTASNLSRFDDYVLRYEE